MTTVIYHSADYDGIFCREIARKFLPDATLIGWNFGDKLIPFPEEGTVYVLDLPLDREFVGSSPWDSQKNRIIWIDHHKSAMDSHPKDIPGYRIDGVAACRLAWQWFSATLTGIPHDLPERQDFIERNVIEPLAVRLAGEYDIWDKRDPAADVLQYGLRCHDDVKWEELLAPEKFPSNGPNYLESVLLDGMSAQSYAKKVDADLVTYKSYRMTWEGLNWLVLNTGRFNSLTFAALDKPVTGHDALLGYMFNGKVWTVSLYHAKHRTDLDLSKIAVKHGGGGHKGACGFTCKSLPFL